MVGRGVPAHPVAHVAAEAGAVEEGRVIAVDDHLRVPSLLVVVLREVTVVVVVVVGGGGA